MNSDTPLRFLKGVGPARAEKLTRLGLATIEDLAYVFPFRYEDRRSFGTVASLAPGQAETTLDVRVERARLIRTRRRNFTIFEAVLADESGSIRAIWYNQPYLDRLFAAGRRAVVFGKPGLDRYGKNLVLENPDYEFLDESDAEGVHTGRIVPVYRKLGDLTSRMLRGMLFRALSSIEEGSVPDLIPTGVRERHGLLPRLEALREAHFPPAESSLDALASGTSPGQRTLAFEEIFLLQLALALRRRGNREEVRGIAYRVPDDFRNRLAKLLPFRLTEAQHRVLREIGQDLRSPHPMNRLLQGDVGSGKTIVALLTLLVAVENGYQGAFLVPTEILAEQHFRNLSRLLRDTEYRLALLTGSTRAATRKSILARLRSGDVQIVVGTHALFEPDVTFRQLGVVVVDEQHRFGVLQRAALANKGTRPDVLVMTATPIPRSLALTVYGDLDVSAIDELPPGRTPVTTVVRYERDRERVYRGLHEEIARGHQVYVVVPLVDETEKSDLKAATAFAEKLSSEVFPDLSVGLLHGRMRGAEKDRVMERFVRGETNILVSTTVVEVGVDVQNASVMVVEHAERFGLSQLHQLRGRVGRGAAKSYCVLMVGEQAKSREAGERLKIMTETTDGFRIAECDLKLRGPGAVFGTQQHGLTDLQFLAVILRDPALLEAARGAAASMVEGDAASRDDARRILDSLRPAWKSRLDLARVG